MVDFLLLFLFESDPTHIYNIGEEEETDESLERAKNKFTAKW